MIYSKKNYSAFFSLPSVKRSTIELITTRPDKNVSSFELTTRLLTKVKSSKSKPSKKRTEKIVLKFPEQSIITHVGLTGDGSVLDLIGIEHPLLPKVTFIKPSYVEYVAYYEKERKLKILYRCMMMNSFPVGNIHWVLDKWSHVFAIDTNTRELEGNLKVSIVSVIKGTIIGIDRGQGVYKFETYYIEPYVNLTCNPELFAIAKLVSKIIKELPVKASVGIITDCELGLIDEINAKKRSLLPNFFPGLYLPDNFHLMYASAEAARDTFIPNKMMAICERTASEAFKNIHINRKE